MFVLVFQQPLPDLYHSRFIGFYFATNLSFIMSLPSKKPQSSSKAASSPKDAGKAKKVKSSVGAPAQRNQASRKGKRAWRKNVDIEDVEAGMEELRAEERVTG